MSMLPLLECQALSYTLRDGRMQREILHLVSLKARTGDILAILGPSGSGKTTLLGLLGGYLKPTSGRVVWRDHSGNILKNPFNMNSSPLVSFMPQSRWLHPDLNVRDNILLGLGGIIRSWKTWILHTEYFLDLLEIKSVSHLYPNELSAGERQRVVLARALVSPAPILLIDEPTSNVEYEMKEKIIGILITSVLEENRALVMTTHNVDLTQKFKSKLVCMTLQDGSLLRNE